MKLLGICFVITATAAFCVMSARQNQLRKEVDRIKKEADKLKRTVYIINNDYKQALKAENTTF